MKIVSILLPFLLALVIGCQGREPKHTKDSKLESAEAETHDVKTEKETEEAGSGESNEEYDGIENIDSELGSENANSSKPVIIKERPIPKETDNKDDEDNDNDNDDDDDDNDASEMKCGKEGSDILECEGQPGWMKERLKQAAEKISKSRDKSHMRGSYTEQTEFSTELQDGPPSAALTTLKDAFGKLGTKATGAKNGIIELKGKWNQMAFGDRAVMTQTLQAAASNIGKFANAGEDPVGAVQGALNMVAQFAALAGPTGQIISVALSFVSGFLSLFGLGGPKKKSVGEIVREQIDEALALYYEKDLTNQARGVANTFDVSKSYVDSLAQKGKVLTVDQAGSLERNVPLWLGLTFMGTLKSEITSLLKANKREDAKKCLKYIDLYTTIAILKDLILQETAALLPDELKPNREALLVAQNDLREKQRTFLKFLYESDVGKIVIPYFDPDISQISDAYLSKVLQIKNYDRSLAGTWCITPSISGQSLIPLSWSRKYDDLRKDGHPYVTTQNEGCFWKLVPHGNYLFTIVNTYNCPKNDYCNQYMSFDIINDSHTRVTVEDEAILWEIYGFQQKRIRSKWGCPNNKWCDKQLGPQIERGGSSFWTRGTKVTTFHLRDNVGYVWWITKNPKK